MSLTPRQIERISREVARRYPEVAGQRPEIKPRSAELPGYTLTYRSTATAADGQPLPRVVRASVSADGTILKVSVSK